MDPSYARQRDVAAAQRREAARARDEARDQLDLCEQMREDDRAMRQRIRHQLSQIEALANRERRRAAASDDTVDAG